MSASPLEAHFLHLWQQSYPNLELKREYRFHPKRRFRFDFAHPGSRVAIEIQGGVWSRGKSGHKSGSGITADCEKLCCAASAGWLVFPLTDKLLKPGFIVAIADTILYRREIETVLRCKGNENTVQVGPLRHYVFRFPEDVIAQRFNGRLVQGSMCVGYI